MAALALLVSEIVLFVQTQKKKKSLYNAKSHWINSIITDSKVLRKCHLSTQHPPMTAAGSVDVNVEAAAGSCAALLPSTAADLDLRLDAVGRVIAK